MLTKDQFEVIKTYRLTQDKHFVIKYNHVR